VGHTLDDDAAMLLIRSARSGATDAAVTPKRLEPAQG
jgi:hypothetical protein